MPKTIPEALDRVVQLHGDRAALRVKRNGAWAETSWKAYREQATQVARALVALGVQPGEGVAILGYNAPEWVLADVGAVLAGACPAGVYTTSSKEQCQYIVHHCDASVAVVDTADQAAKLIAERARLPALRTIVQWSGEPAGEGVLRWDEFLARGAEAHDAELTARRKAQKLDDVCTPDLHLGDDRKPQGGDDLHGNLTWVAETAIKTNDPARRTPGLSYLPLSHIAEQVLTIYVPMHTGGHIVFAESLEAMPATLGEARPTAFFGVPRVWEKIQAKIEAAGAASPPFRRRIARWARSVGLRGGLASQAGQPRPRLYWLAERLVFSKVKARLGLDSGEALRHERRPDSRARPSSSF